MSAVLAHYGADDPPDTLGWRSIKCCFHDDSHASARYCSSDDTNAFICLACGVKGDAIALVESQEGLEYLDAVKFIEENIGIGVESDTATPSKKYKAVRRSGRGAKRRRAKVNL